jgi:hypothetical protein
MGVPKMVLYGPYGAGKTHTLHHIKWYLETDADAVACEVRVVKTPYLREAVRLQLSIQSLSIRSVSTSHARPSTRTWGRTPALGLKTSPL